MIRCLAVLALLLCGAASAANGWSLDCKPADISFDFSWTGSGSIALDGQTYPQAAINAYGAFLLGNSSAATFAPSPTETFVECRAKYSGRPQKKEPGPPSPLTDTLILDSAAVFGPISGIDTSRLLFMVEADVKHPDPFSQTRSLVTTPQPVANYLGKPVAQIDSADRDVTFRIHYLLVVRISDGVPVGATAVQDFLLNYRLEPVLLALR